MEYFPNDQEEVAVTGEFVVEGEKSVIDASPDVGGFILRKMPKD